MGQTFCSLHAHCVFSTKEREPWIDSELEPRLWAYLGGIARELGIKPLCIGGMPDHVHLLLSMPTTIAPAKAIQTIKGNSSKWVHDTFPKRHLFEWQKGYGIFSVSQSRISATVAYIETQREHHQKLSFQDELLAILRKHGIAYDERYIWE